MTEAEAIGDLLGIDTGGAGSRLALADLVVEGLPLRTLDRVVANVSPNDTQLRNRLVSKASLARRKQSSRKRLSSAESERIARLAKVMAFAMGIYGEEDKAREFIRRRHPMLDNKSPMDVAIASGPGSDAVINILGRAAYSGGV